MLASLISLLAVNNLVAQPTMPNVDSRPVPSIVAYAEKTGTSLRPSIQAAAVLSIDLDTGKLLYRQNADSQLPMASLTKLMTIMVILQEHSLDEIVSVDKRATNVEPSKMNLLANEQITVRELIKGMIIKSANDAALALAYFDAGDPDEFVKKMNKEAARMGLAHTHFQNPVGFDDPAQYSTAEDLGILARAVYKKPFIGQIAGITKTSVSSVDQKQTHELEATNSMIGSYLKVLGLKTGTTDEAGQCLITIVESPEGNRIMNILLNSPSRFNESKIMSQWIFDNYSWI